MAELRYLHEMPIHILQEFIFILRSNDKFIGEGKIDKYFISKTEQLATLIYDNGKVSYTANFVKDEDGNWFFNDRMSIRESLKSRVDSTMIKRDFPSLDHKVEVESETE